MGKSIYSILTEKVEGLPTSTNVDSAEHVLYHSNYDLQSIVTPVRVNQLVSQLKRYSYDTDAINFLEDRFTNGFDIGYKGPQIRQSSSKNLPLRVGNKTDLWNKIMKEVELGCVAGPYNEIPFENYIQSPIGLVPKAGSNSGKTRLIFHLSYNFKDEKSLNYNTPREKCSVTYRDLR